MSAAMHIAEFNCGRLLHPWGDPRIAPFEDAVAQVNAIAARSPGFVWMSPEAEMDAAQRDPHGPFGGDPRIASTLSVWESVAALASFARDTLHGRFMARGAEWLEPPTGPNFVMWRVVPGVRPTVAEGVRRLERIARDGAGPEAFDWDYAAREEGSVAA